MLFRSGDKALSSPSMLAAIFIEIEPKALSPRGTSGIKCLKSGSTPREKKDISWAFSAILKIPSHKHSVPINPMAISADSFAIENKEVIT